MANETSDFERATRILNPDPVAALPDVVIPPSPGSHAFEAAISIEKQAALHALALAAQEGWDASDARYMAAGAAVSFNRGPGKIAERESAEENARVQALMEKRMEEEMRWWA